ncbi:MAG TPA: hypothetical protein VHU82_05585 [Vicinamibacterales bacterium]|nr:hypothetical protein [Vicinamibacterales bacterium]
MRKTLSSFALIAAFGVSALVPATVSAQDRDHERAEHEHRVYDRAHRDYHNWNKDEDHVYREYLEQHHRRYRVFSRLTRAQQRAYWQWRHEHER